MRDACSCDVIEMHGMTKLKRQCGIPSICVSAAGLRIIRTIVTTEARAAVSAVNLSAESPINNRLCASIDVGAA